MNDNQRFSILTFPQYFDGAELSVNIVVLPRDQNPLSEAIEQHPTISDAVPFADAQLAFSAGIFNWEGCSISVGVERRRSTMPVTIARASIVIPSLFRFRHSGVGCLFVSDVTTASASVSSAVLVTSGISVVFCSDFTAAIRR